MVSKAKLLIELHIYLKLKIIHRSLNMLDDDIVTISLEPKIWDYYMYIEEVEIREKVSYMRSQWSHAMPQVTRRLATWNII